MPLESLLAPVIVVALLICSVALLLLCVEMLLSTWMKFSRR